MVIANTSGFLRILPRPVLIAVTYLLMLATVSAEREPDVSAEEFLRLVRRQPVLECWVRMEGTMQSKNETTGRRKVPVQFRLHVQTGRSKSQLIIDDRPPVTIEHSLESDHSMVTLKPENSTTLSEFGIRPDDLTLGFLYWDFAEELRSRRIRGQACRVFAMTAPVGDESLHVFITRKYLFPLRGRWFTPAADGPVRTLEFTGFKKVNDLWMVTEARISRPDESCIVKFKTVVAHTVTADNPLPDDLFVQ